jgi:hypothetical protein
LQIQVEQGSVKVTQMESWKARARVEDQEEFGM